MNDNKTLNIKIIGEITHPMKSKRKNKVFGSKCIEKKNILIEKINKSSPENGSPSSTARV